MIKRKHPRTVGIVATITSAKIWCESYVAIQVHGQGLRFIPDSDHDPVYKI